MPSSSLFLRSSATLVSALSLVTSVFAAPKHVFERASTAPYLLRKEYAGSTFFDQFTFFDSADPTHGYVTYVDRNDAQTQGSNPNQPPLISYDGRWNYMRVDSTAVLTKTTGYYNQNGVGRKSVRIEGNDKFTHGLVITHIDHMPSGICGTWPAFWTLGDNWPYNGEIDIIEGANNQGGNWMSLHTGSSSNINGDNAAFSAQIASTDCNVYTNGQQNPNYTGCKFEDGDQSTFRSYTGGYWAMQWTSDGISVWYWPDGSEPTDVTSYNPKPSAWGTPRSAFAPSQNLRVDANFNMNHLVFDTTFCGDLGDATWQSTGCATSTGYSSCADYVAANPSAFEDAYWKVEYVRVFQNDNPALSTTTTSSATTSSTTSTTSSTTTTTTSSSTTSTSSSSTTAASTTSPTSSSTASSSSSTTSPTSSSSTSTASSTSSSSASTGSSVSLTTTVATTTSASTTTTSESTTTATTTGSTTGSSAQSTTTGSVSTGSSTVSNSATLISTGSTTSGSSTYTTTSSATSNGAVLISTTSSSSWVPWTTTTPAANGWETWTSSTSPADPSTWMTWSTASNPPASSTWATWNTWTTQSVDPWNSWASTTTPAAAWNTWSNANNNPAGGFYANGNSDEWYTTTITATITVPCSTAPYWQQTTTIYVTSVPVHPENYITQTVTGTVTIPCTTAPGYVTTTTTYITLIPINQGSASTWATWQSAPATQTYPVLQVTVQPVPTGIASAAATWSNAAGVPVNAASTAWNTASVPVNAASTATWASASVATPVNGTAQWTGYNPASPVNAYKGAASSIVANINAVAAIAVIGLAVLL